MESSPPQGAGRVWFFRFTDHIGWLVLVNVVWAAFLSLLFALAVTLGRKTSGGGAFFLMAGAAAFAGGVSAWPLTWIYRWFSGQKAFPPGFRDYFRLAKMTAAAGAVGFFFAFLFLSNLHFYSFLSRTHFVWAVFFLGCQWVVLWVILGFWVLGPPVYFYSSMPFPVSLKKTFFFWLGHLRESFVLTLFEGFLGGLCILWPPLFFLVGLSAAVSFPAVVVEKYFIHYRMEKLGDVPWAECAARWEEEAKRSWRAWWRPWER